MLAAHREAVVHRRGKAGLIAGQACIYASLHLGTGHCILAFNVVC
jgi:hypothetical protein